MNADETSVHELPSVSVLLPAWNEAKMIGRCLDSLLAIDWPNSRSSFAPAVTMTH